MTTIPPSRRPRPDEPTPPAAERAESRVGPPEASVPGGTRPAGRQVDPWRQLRLALRVHPSRAQLATAVLLALLGFAAVRALGDIHGQDKYAGATREQLVQILDGLTQQSRRLSIEIAELNGDKARLESGGDTAQTALAQARQRAETLGILAGTLPAAGPGIRITISDPDHAVPAAVVLNTVQELRDAGAEAMAIDGTSRLVASSYVVDAPDGLLVDGQPVRPPYVIEAIGDPTSLATAMRIPGGVVDEVDSRGGAATVSERSSITITALHAATPGPYASPAPAPPTPARR